MNPAYETTTGTLRSYQFAETNVRQLSGTLIIPNDRLILPNASSYCGPRLHIFLSTSRKRPLIYLDKRDKGNNVT